MPPLCAQIVEAHSQVTGITWDSGYPLDRLPTRSSGNTCNKTYLENAHGRAKPCSARPAYIRFQIDLKEYKIARKSTNQCNLGHTVPIFHQLKLET